MVGEWVVSMVAKKAYFAVACWAAQRVGDSAGLWDASKAAKRAVDSVAC